MSYYLLFRNSNYDHVIIMIMILKHDFFLIWQKWASTDTCVAELEQWKVSEQLGCTLLIYSFIFVFFFQRLELAMEHFVLLPQRAFGALTFCEQVRMFSTHAQTGIVILNTCILNNTQYFNNMHVLYSCVILCSAMNMHY